MAASSCSSTHKYLITLILIFSMYFQNEMNCNASQTFSFEMHHRFSDQVKSILGADNLPEKGSPEYYAIMVHRDKVFRGRALGKNDVNDSKLLTFSEGNKTHRYGSLGFLHYANVSLGTPSVSFLVALDTGSDLFWVPCDCANCNRTITTSSGVVRNVNIYSSHSSSTSKNVSGNNSLCEPQTGCSESSGQCPFKIGYRDGAFTCGVYVEDILHLATENHEARALDARITFGCGQNVSSPTGAAPNGLLGLGMGNISVPSILSSKGLIANSFSMCFGFDGVGRIEFGDKGSFGQAEIPLNPMEPTEYEVNVTRISVGRYLSDPLDFSAIFDSGTSFTSLSDPAYTIICERFNSQVQHKRHPPIPTIPFDHCYDVSLTTEFQIPNVSLIMKDGRQFDVKRPAVPVRMNQTTGTYCLAIIKSPDEKNIIGQNFMTGYNIIYDREKMVLGWKASNCTDEIVDPGAQSKIP